MLKILSLFLFALLLSISVFSQTATKIDEISLFPCGHMMMLMDTYNQELKEKPQDKLYIIYYEGSEKRSVSIYNPKTKKYKSTLENPRFGNALNRAKEVPLYLKMMHKIPDDRIVLVDGGFRRNFSLEIWSVPKGAETPKATPTLERKDIKFAKGKPPKPRKLALCYDGY